jgi:hemoglobin/transferrin/lactoferrin receptor protein
MGQEEVTGYVYPMYQLTVVILATSAVLGAASFPPPAAAAEVQDDQSGVIDQIVVVAHKTERSIRDIAANVTVMNRADLKSQLATSIADVFRYAPGIDYEAAGTRFGTEGINIRGIGGNRVALIVDGVPLSEQFDIGSFSNATRDFLNAGLIEQVEVLHGPASALYGSAAIGGVVAVRTPDPVDISGTRGHGGDVLATWRDADGSRHGTAMLAVGDASRGFLAGASWREGEQTDSAALAQEIDLKDYERKSALLKMVADDPSGHTWRVGFIHQQAAGRTDLHSMLGSGRFRSTTRLEGDDEYAMDLASLTVEFGSPGGWVDSGVLRGYYEIAQVDQSTLDERTLASRPVSIDRFFHFEQEIAGLELNLQKEITGNRTSHRLGFGIEYRWRTTEEYRDGLEHDLESGAKTSVILGEDFPLRDFPISDTSELGAYLEDAVSFGKWSLVGAIRADRFELSPKSDPMYAEDFPFAAPVSLSESDISPKLGVIYHATPATDIYLQYAHGFRAPPYEDANIGLEIPVFNFRAIPNPDLKSESSDGFDLGMRWQGTWSSVRLALFHTRYDDFIESKVRLGIDPDSGRLLFQSLNIDETEIRGLEAGWQLRLPGRLNAFSLDGALYIARGENSENGQPLNSVGPAQGVMAIDWSAASGKTSVRLRATLTEAWDDRDESGGELFKPPGHAVVDLFATRRISQRATMRAGLLNLTDKTYWHWSDVRGLAEDDPVLPVLARAGRSITISLNMSW